jgi:hypothetical protein
MADREKVIRGLRDIDMFIAERFGHEKAKNFLRTIDETIILLKEQEAHKFFVDESGKITPLPVVVRCKDCKHRPIKPNDYENGFDLEFPDNKCPCQNGDDGWYSWYPADNWYCAEGERRTE